VKFLGVAAAAIAVGVTIVILAQVYQFGASAPGDNRPVLAAPQASIMQALVEGFMNRQPIAYVLFFAGAMMTIAMEMLGVPALIFALGMYLPLELNTPALVGGWISHLVNKRSEREGAARGRTIRERGVIIASGLMAGGALGGVFGAACRLLPAPGAPDSVGHWYSGLVNLLPRYAENRIKTPFYDNDMTSQLVSLVLFLGLCVYLWVESNRRTRQTT
jgi:uncharacterized oligopeptide transporter (OPT) family protein